MARTTIPWGDGSGDNIYLDYDSAVGDQAVAVSSDANAGSARTKVVTFSASGVSPVTLTVTQAGGLPAGATAYDWLHSDGTQFINTGVGNGKTTSQVKIETTTGFESGTPQYSWTIWASTSAGNLGIQYGSSSSISVVGGGTQYTQQNNPTYRKVVTVEYPNIKVVSPYSTTVTRSMTSTTYTSDFLLLANSGGSRIAKGSFRRTKIWVDGVLVRDYQPCTDSNGRAAAYDFVTGTFNYGANESGNDFTVFND